MKKVILSVASLLLLSGMMLVSQTAAASANTWSITNSSNTDIDNVYIGHFTQDDVDNNNIGDDWLGQNRYLYVDGNASWSNRRGCIFDLVVEDDNNNRVLIPRANLCNGYDITDSDWNPDD